ncbi:bifunctional (p)ppGpp synthetase/guanosine-3',5'-bis(diphosphate) 3'-pyrophosphohydrolase [Hymenobacter taeanensis]|uniref:Bifunctional (P)ppGpp synthetase/guanosine-3',5'-bis(Diphosphate) 3'-pyrophosphohydrolase n=1 Tax=Hymenobacter taeanensis TaxID=2735321 RepID=A0A6M6BEF3_9BACT|nr:MULTISPECIES: bifunctional (p)ppGpp synthetase/guanosine-3',5'-bis(diphosphate) 3'-pyrophosphohydrolase [Hymenobacter]QJX45603.1 bifunctional (p)ppGpp synthetase/guanosine-3',5'-bis(diphosphate) 3'-pyrophosphohydrolase [Hymenobacter taeanensis]UOQ79436.1 bifunctional (p)ppGpp synthetase/guanosine-3',5'-bis(diphosphate) 3'-pyrophosphohydrolase [Hymenobacter sp. 5414T-23]
MPTVIDPEVERQEILRHYRRLLRTAKPYLKEGDAKLIKKAFNTSLEAHKEMRRKSGEPYILHPLAVAQIVVEEIGLGTTSIVAALLHDVVEDTPWEIADVEREFGNKVARIVDGLTKISGVFEYGTSEQAENFRKMLLTLSEDVRVILIKLADRLHNMRTLDSMPRHKQLKIASETIYLYAPLAHRLGLYAIKTELEDLYLKYTDTEVYNELVNRVRQSRSARNRFIKEFVLPIDDELKAQGFGYEIKGRPKSIYSILKKMRKQNITFDEVYDLFAIRVILDVPQEQEKAACWQVYSIVTDFYQPNPDRLRDWVSTPKANGYESLHTTVMSRSGQWVEVQIRSRRMDDIAEKGYAAHWKYKDSGAIQPESTLEAWINKVREMLETNNSSALEFMDEFRQNLFVKEVYAFTPKGKLVILPDKATALDFAFEIHTHIGLRCLGAKVNQKLQPLSYELRNGDQVEILTSQKQRPTEEWLQYVITSKARSKIKEWLRDDKKSKAEDGRFLVEKRLELLGIEYTPDNLNRLLAHFNTRNAQEFFYRLAIGQIDGRDIKTDLFDPAIEVPRSPSMLEPKAFDHEVQKIRGLSANMLVIGEQTDKFDYTIAPCCNPIPGDDVFGFETEEGIVIHRTSCPKAVQMMSNYGNRIVRAKWTEQLELAFLAGIRIKGSDRVGLVNDVTRIISNSLKVNMRSITIDSNDGMFEGQIMVFVNDTDHLNKMIQRLSKVNGVLQVERFDSSARS